MKALVVSAHPDDETLGAGGTILKLKASGHEVHWLNFTHMSVKSGYTSSQVKKRAQEIQAVKAAYGFDSFTNLEFFPAGLDRCSRQELVKKAKEVVMRVMPETIFLPFRGDPHSDHQVVFETMAACTKTFRAPFIQEVLAMEILSETEFAASDKGFVSNYFVDISACLQKKIKIMQFYQGELGRHPFPRSVENMKALALHRGASAGCRFAEAFMLLKKIVS